MPIPSIFEGNEESSQIIEGSDFLWQISLEWKVVGRCGFHCWIPHLTASTCVLCRSWDRDRIMCADVDAAVKMLKEEHVSNTERVFRSNLLLAFT